MSSGALALLVAVVPAASIQLQLAARDVRALPHMECSASLQGDSCYIRARQAMRYGIARAPEDHPTLAADSSFADLQAALHVWTELAEVCAAPCSGGQPPAAMRLMKSSKKGKDCHTAVEGEDCHKQVLWARNHGIMFHPQWYTNLTRQSSFEDFQGYLHRTGWNQCPAPCEAAQSCRTARQGEACHREVTWAMQHGIVERPGWYPNLTASSSFEDFQAFLHGLDAFSPSCPKPCEAQSRRTEDCHTAVEGEHCHAEVYWARTTGIHTHPEWYKTLTVDSSFEDFQAFLHTQSDTAKVCKEPCEATAPEERKKPLEASEDCRTTVQGESCHREATWIKTEGVVAHPAWFPGLTADAPLEDFQSFLHSLNPFVRVCPSAPCAPVPAEAEAEAGAEVDAEVEVEAEAAEPAADSSDKSNARQRVADGSTAAEPTTEEKPTVDQSTAAETSTEETPKADESAAAEPTTEETPKADDSAAAEPTTEGKPVAEKEESPATMKSEYKVEDIPLQDGPMLEDEADESPNSEEEPPELHEPPALPLDAASGDQKESAGQAVDILAPGGSAPSGSQSLETAQAAQGVQGGSSPQDEDSSQEVPPALDSAVASAAPPAEQPQGATGTHNADAFQAQPAVAQPEPMAAHVLPWDAQPIAAPADMPPPPAPVYRSRLPAPPPSVYIPSVSQPSQPAQLPAGAPPPPKSPGCFVWLPDGCKRHKFAAKLHWKRDEWGENNARAGDDPVACEARKDAFFGFCGTTNVVTHLFRPEEISPKDSQGVESAAPQSLPRAAQPVAAPAAMVPPPPAAMAPPPPVYSPAVSQPSQPAQLPAGAPPPPESPGCFVWLPDGCKVHKFKAKRHWKRDDYGELKMRAGASAAACEARKISFFGFCGTQNVVMHLFTPQEVAPQGSVAPMILPQATGTYNGAPLPPPAVVPSADEDEAAPMAPPAPPAPAQPLAPPASAGVTKQSKYERGDDW